MTPREPLTRELVVDAAARVADVGGLVAVSMRSVAREVGVEAMSLYHHVASKEALLDALADWVFSRMEAPDLEQPWRAAMTARALSARAVLTEHPWGLGLVETRDPGPSLLRYHDAVLGCLLGAGFSVRLAGHAVSVLDAYVYGFVLTEVNLPFSHDDGAVEEYLEEVDLPMAEYPHLARFVEERILHQGYTYAEEFDQGLALILDALEQRFAAAV